MLQLNSPSNPRYPTYFISITNSLKLNSLNKKSSLSSDKLTLTLKSIKSSKILSTLKLIRTILNTVSISKLSKSVYNFIKSFTNIILFKPKICKYSDATVPHTCTCLSANIFFRGEVSYLILSATIIFYLLL